MVDERSVDSNTRATTLGAVQSSALRDAWIVEALEAPDAELRERAVALAARHLSPEALGELVRNEGNATLRNSALSALERQGPWAVPHLLRLTKDADGDVVMFAVQVLARVGDPTSVGALIGLLDHPDSNVVQAAVEAMGNLRARAAVPRLLDLLSADVWVQFAAITALGQIGDVRAIGPLHELVADEMLGENAVEALGKLGARESLSRLLPVLVGTDRLPLRDHCLRAIAAILERNAIDHVALSRAAPSAEPMTTLADYLQKAIASAERDFARAAARVIVAARLREAFPDVLCRCDDVEDAQWTLTLFRRHSRACRAVPAQLGHHPDARVRRACLMLGCPPACAGRFGMVGLRDSDVGVRTAACWALGRARVAEAVPALIEVLLRGDGAERDAAVEALARMPSATLGPVSAILREHLERDVLLAAIRVVELSRRAGLISEVVAHLDSPDVAVRRAALRALAAAPSDVVLDRARRAFEDPDESVRVEAVELLARRGRPGADAVLLPLLRAEGPLNYHVIRALGRLRAHSAFEPLSELYDRALPHERIEIVAAMPRLGHPRAIEFLDSRFRDGDVETRRVAAGGIGSLARKRDLALLQTLANDDDWAVRNHAAWGLGRLKVEGARATLLLLARDVEPTVARTARHALDKLTVRTNSS